MIEECCQSLLDAWLECPTEVGQLITSYNEMFRVLELPGYDEIVVRIDDVLLTLSGGFDAKGGFLPKSLYTIDGNGGRNPIDTPPGIFSISRAACDAVVDDRNRFQVTYSTDDGYKEGQMNVVSLNPPLLLFDDVFTFAHSGPCVYCDDPRWSFEHHIRRPYPACYDNVVAESPHASYVCYTRNSRANDPFVGKFAIHQLFDGKVTSMYGYSNMITHVETRVWTKGPPAGNVTLTSGHDAYDPVCVAHVKCSTSAYFIIGLDQID